MNKLPEEVKMERKNMNKELIEEYLQYDSESGLLFWIKKPSKQCRMKIGDTAGSKNASGYITLTLKGEQYQAHRVAYLLEYGELKDEGYVIDHINGNRSDNRKENLREVTYSENAKNTHKDWKEINGISEEKAKMVRISEEAYNKIDTKRGRMSFIGFMDELVLDNNFNEPNEITENETEIKPFI